MRADAVSALRSMIQPERVAGTRTKTAIDQSTTTSCDLGCAVVRPDGPDATARAGGVSR